MTRMFSALLLFCASAFAQTWVYNPFTGNLDRVGSATAPFGTAQCVPSFVAGTGTIASPCTHQLGTSTYTLGSNATFTAVAGTFTVYVYRDSAGVLTAAYQSGSPTVANITFVTGTSYPPESMPIARFTLTAGSFTAVTDDRPAFFYMPDAAGANVTLTYSGGTRTISVPGALVTNGGNLNAQNMVVGNGANSITSTSDFSIGGAGFRTFGANGNSTDNLTYIGGGDANFNTAIGSNTVRGGDAGSGGGASSNGGAVLVRGGANSVASATTAAGSVQILAGRADGSTQGLQGLGQWLQTYIKGTTVTQFNLQCESASMTVADCGASPTNWIGVAEIVNSNTVQVAVTPSLMPINASAAVTLGHTVNAGATAGKVTDSGGTTWTAGATVGVVVAVSGTWPASTQADGLTFTASTTLPLIQMGR